MDALVQLLVIGIVCRVESEAVAATGGTRPGGYGPLVFAAVPLHAPVPVLHVLSRRPPPDLDLQETAPPPRYRQRPRPSRPAYEESYEYTHEVAPARAARPRPALAYEEEYAQPTRAYSTSHLYSSSVETPTPYEVYATGEGADSSPLLYARPLPSGGYAYRRAAPAPAPLAPPAKLTKEPPYIIKIHKYRIVRDRRRRRR